MLKLELIKGSNELNANSKTTPTRMNNNPPSKKRAFLILAAFKTLKTNKNFIKTSPKNSATPIVLVGFNAKVFKAVCKINNTLDCALKR